METTEKERQILFLYPDMAEINDEKEREKIILLINHLKLVIDSANESMATVLLLRVMSDKFCIPIVKMKQIKKKLTSSSEISDFNDCQRNLRICMTSFNGKNYYDNYKDIINIDRQKNQITHLIDIVINNSCEKPKWMKSSYANFDVRVETNINDLENIILSILIDISLYYSYGIKDDFIYRKNFGIIKRDFILSTIPAAYLNNIYGSKRPELKKLSYLPISYIYINDIKQKEILENCINKFCELIINNIFGKIIIDDDEITEITSNSYYDDKITSFELMNNKDLIINSFKNGQKSKDKKDDKILISLKNSEMLNDIKNILHFVNEYILINGKEYVLINKEDFFKISSYFPYLVVYSICEV